MKTSKNITRAYETAGGVRVTKQILSVPYADGVKSICKRLDTHCGVVLASGFEFPGRYSRLDMGFTDPPLQIVSKDRSFYIKAMNSRGEVLLPALAPALRENPDIAEVSFSEGKISGSVREDTKVRPEEERSRQASIFSMLRTCIDVFAFGEEQHLGLYGAFAYDLCFQFEPIRLRLPRPGDQRDLVLFLPDEITIADHASGEAVVHKYDFQVGDASTEGMARETPAAPIGSGTSDGPIVSDHGPGEYIAAVEKARQAFYRGDLFEAVLSQTFSKPMNTAPSVVFDRLAAANPSPYGALMNLGEGEALVAASPEMFVRVDGDRVETCPISGTAPRGIDAIEDAENVRKLLNSEKDAAELTMCTDVDRNDKSRVCVPGSVRVLGRRQLEFYSKLIHTVDHVEGILASGFDAIDAFLTHMWAVTVTGAPKAWAMQFVEDTEKSARRWYGGAIGRITFDGNMNTGLTIRSARFGNGSVEVRAGATLLYDSEPKAEDAECRLKASALFEAIEKNENRGSKQAVSKTRLEKEILLVDHQDSFVHTLGGYFRQLGAKVTTLRPDAARARIASGDCADLVVLSPGPGRPSDFNLNETLKLIERRNLPAFGVCLGLQGMVEFFGGALKVLPYPMHGKSTLVTTHRSKLFASLPEQFEVGRYHSLVADASTFPVCLEVTASTNDGVIMAIEHKERPWSAVQFHPESILTPPQVIGLPLLRSVLEKL